MNSRISVTPKTRYDVAVVGAGLAGLYCARLLAERGLCVLLLDRKRALDRAIQTTGIFVRRTFDDFSFPAECLGPPIRRVTLYSPSRHRLVLESQRDEFRVGRMGEFYEKLLEDCIRSGVAWRPATRFAGSLAEREGSLLFLQTPNGACSARAQFMVGADGCLSRVARDLGLNENREWIVAVEDVFEGSISCVAPCLHCFLDPELAPGYIAWAADDGQSLHLGIGGYPLSFDPQQALGRFKAIVQEILGPLRGRWRERRGGRIPVGGMLRRIACPRGLLVGDAAGAPSPLTAGGLDACLRLSKFAARVAADYVPTGDERILSAYSGSRFRARFISRIWMRRLFAHVRPRATWETAFAVLRLPGFRSIARQIFFGPRSFPDVETSYAKSARHSEPQGDSSCILYHPLRPSSS